MHADASRMDKRRLPFEERHGATIIATSCRWRERSGGPPADAGQDVLIASAMRASCPLGLARGDFAVEIPPAFARPATGHSLRPCQGHKHRVTPLERAGDGNYKGNFPTIKALTAEASSSALSTSLDSIVSEEG